MFTPNFLNPKKTALLLFIYLLNTATILMCQTQLYSGWVNDLDLAQDRNMLYLVWSEYNYGMYYMKSSNSGQTWSTEIPLQQGNEVYDVGLTSDQDDLYLVWVEPNYSTKHLKFNMSTDEGLTWLGTTTLFDSPYFEDVGISARNDILHLAWIEPGYATSNNVDVGIHYSRSTDQGTSWSTPTVLYNLENGSSYYMNVGIASNDQQSVHLAWSERGYQPRIAYMNSSDSGQSWSQDFTLTEPGYPVYVSVSAEQNRVHLMWINSPWERDEMYYNLSEDNGSLWTDDYLYMTDNYIGDVDLSAAGDSVHLVYIGSGYPYAIYYSLLSDLTLIDNNDYTGQIPKGYYLYQNFPNPFNPSTTIKFTIPRGTADKVSTRIDIYSIRGKRIRTLLDEEREPGAHSVQWDGRIDSGIKAQSGVYLYSIIAGEFHSTRKMVMLE